MLWRGCPEDVQHLQGARSCCDPMGRKGEGDCLLMSNCKVIKMPPVLSLWKQPTANHRLLQDILFFLENLLFPSSASLSWSNTDSFNLSLEGLFNQFLLLSSGHSMGMSDFIHSWIGQSILIRIASCRSKHSKRQCPDGSDTGTRSHVWERPLWTLGQHPRERDADETAKLTLSSLFQKKKMTEENWFSNNSYVPSKFALCQTQYWT